MLHLLKIEWLKVKNYRTFWILLLLILISIPALNYMVFDVGDNSFGKNAKQVQRMLLGRPFSFPLVWRTVSWWSGFVLFIPALLLITLTTNEFTYKTHRQNIIDGLSRTQFIGVKLLEVVLLSLFTSLLVFISALWIGHLARDPGEQVNQFENLKQVGYFFIEVLTYLLFALLLCIWIKRAGLVLGIFFLYSLIFEPIVVSILSRFANDAGRFFPLETSDRLLINPYSRLLNTPEAIDKIVSQLPLYFVIALVYIILYTSICIWYFRKKDL